jgi:hypothetical protein
LNRKGRATCLAVLSKEGGRDTTNLQYSIDNIQFGSGFAGLGFIKKPFRGAEKGG